MPEYECWNTNGVDGQGLSTTSNAQCRIIDMKRAGNPYAEIEVLANLIDMLTDRGILGPEELNQIMPLRNCRIERIVRDR
jgi:hypothetical protein